MLTAAMIARAWRTPLGGTIDTAMARLHADERAAIADTRGYGFTVAPIRDQPAASRNDRYLRRMGLLGMEVAREAMAAVPASLDDRARIGLFAGVGGLRAHWDDMMRAFEAQRDDGEGMWKRGLANVHPYWMLRHLSNNVHALASAQLDVRGEGATFGGGNGGAQAIAAAVRALHDVDASGTAPIDAALVVAYDSLLEPETLVELAARENDPGFVPGEAAAAIVLVREHAGAPRISARARVGSGSLAGCFGERAQVTIIDTHRISAAMGQLGAATSLVQAIALSEMLRGKGEGAHAVGLHTSAPNLASGVYVEVSA